MGIAKKTMSFDAATGTAAATVVSGAGYVSALTATGDGTNLATVTLHNATSGSGSDVYILSTTESASVTFTPPIRLDTGVRVTVGGTGCNYAIAYKAE